ncbi:MAG: DUF6088 family protein [Hyphomicrobiaceae bacterium]|nr:DUF6088 family protein [Hyphomicrobiaceae bacterium]
MSVTENIRIIARKVTKSKPFTNERFLKLGSRASVDKALSRLVEEGVIERAAPGVFFRPKKSRYVGSVMPGLPSIIEAIAKSNGEIVQVHGAEAVRQFKISTQMPTKPIYYTSGSSREIHVGKRKVKLMHTSNSRRLQHAGEKEGLALSALWYLGKKQVNTETIHLIRSAMSVAEFKKLRDSDMPAWMAQAINQNIDEATVEEKKYG